MFTLTDGQQLAVSTFNRFSESPTDQFMVLSGPAGTGKTTVVNTILANYSGKTVITTPTHKSLGVLVKKTDPENYADSMTIHSLLSLRLKKKNHKEELYLEKDAPDKLFEGDYTLIVVDECSMVGSDLLSFLTEKLQDFPYVKVLFIGDNLQLPPVGESLSLTFTVPEIKVELTEVVRQAMDNPIIALTVQVREAIQAVNEDIIDFTTREFEGKGVFVYPKAGGFRNILNNEADKQEDDPDAFRMIAWKNVTVNRYNDAVRKHIYNGAPKDDFLVGEKVTINDSIDLGEGQFLPRDTVVTIRSVTPTKVNTFFVITKEPLEAYDLFVETDDGTRVTVKALSSVSKRSYDRALKTLGETANWGVFWKLKETFTDVRYTYSITSHKSQASTYTKAFVDCDDILSNRNTEEALKSLYVAISRASEQVHLLYKT